MARMSARKLGELIGLTASEANRQLKERGFLEGKPDIYGMTEEGAEHSETVYRDNGYGGYAARSRSYDIWDENVSTCYPREI